MTDAIGREPAREQAEVPQPNDMSSMEPKSELPAPDEPGQNPLALPGVYQIPASPTTGEAA